MFRACNLKYTLFLKLIGYSWLHWVFIAAHRLLRAGASLVKHGLEAHGLQELQHMGSTVANRGLPSTGSVAVAHGLRCPEACGIFPD